MSASNVTVTARPAWAVAALLLAGALAAPATAGAGPSAVEPATERGAVPAAAIPGVVAAAPGAPGPLAGPGVCSAAVAAPAGADYYAIDLVPTARVPGTRNAGGVAQVAFARSPFGISISPGGAYVYDVEIQAEGLPSRDGGRYVAWVTASDLSAIRRVGDLDASLRAAARVDWNKFLVVVTLEPVEAADDAAIWEGPIVLRGMSRSGRMHTMAGHGAFQAEPCAKYGFR